MKIKLNLPEYPLKIVKREGEVKIFDELRKKYLVLTPEEYVRQHLVHYLIREKSVPQGLISLEKGLNLYQRKKRTDVLVYNREAQPLLLVECKAASVEINQDVVDQAFRYNLQLKAKWLMLSNGIRHIVYRVDYENQKVEAFQDLPEYSDL